MSETASREDLFAALEEAPRKEPFTLPGGKQVWVEEMSYVDWLRWQFDLADHAPAKEGSLDECALARLVVRCVTDGKGTFLLKPADAERLARGRGRIAKRLVQLCREVNGLDVESVEQAKKNSAVPPISTSSTGSPETAATSM
jgi:hypothetical protein